MNNKPGFSKIGKAILSGSSVVAIAIITDILIHRDISHPLTYFNRVVTAFNCPNSNCKNTLRPAISPHKGMVVISQHLVSNILVAGSPGGLSISTIIVLQAITNIIGYNMIVCPTSE